MTPETNNQSERNAEGGEKPDETDFRSEKFQCLMRLGPDFFFNAAFGFFRV